MHSAYARREQRGRGRCRRRHHRHHPPIQFIIKIRRKERLHVCRCKFGRGFLHAYEGVSENERSAVVCLWRGPMIIQTTFFFVIND